MSATLTPYGRGLLLQAVFMPEDYAPPAGLWLTYCRSVPVANSDGSQLDEPTAGGYARAPMGALSHDNWDFTGFAEAYNINQILFPAPTGLWGLMVGWAICNSDTIGDGECVAVGAIIEPFQVDNGDSAPYVDVAGLAIGLYD